MTCLHPAHWAAASASCPARVWWSRPQTPLSRSFTPPLHALGLQMEDGTELLIHVGVDTVEMNGDGFHSFVKEGDKVKKGDKLLSFDIDKIKAAGHNTTVSVIVSNSDDFKAVEGLPGDPVNLSCSVIRTVH